MIESSGGKNFDHKELQSGIHKGQRAIGRYGLMPNTVNETLTRMKHSGTLSDDLAPYRGMDPADMKNALEVDSDSERAIAESLANRVLERQQGDTEKSAYGWFNGHNLSPESIEERGYKDTDYVNKYNKFKKQLFGGADE
jgi:hypothetical protein